MTDINSSAVALPPGSYDYDALKKGLDAAAKGAAAKYSANVEKAIAAAADNIHSSQDARDIPGYKFVDVENKDLGVTERVQVFDKALADKAPDAGDDAISAADAINNGAKATAAASSQE